MRLLIAIIGFFTCQTVYQKFIRAVMCIGKLTKLSNILCKIIRGMFEMNCLLSSSSISTWGTIKTNTYLYRAIQYLHNGV